MARDLGRSGQISRGEQRTERENMLFFFNLNSVLYNTLMMAEWYHWKAWNLLFHIYLGKLFSNKCKFLRVICRLNLLLAEVNWAALARWSFGTNAAQFIGLSQSNTCQSINFDFQKLNNSLEFAFNEKWL